MSRTIVIYNPFAFYYYELEVNLEIVNDHLSQDDKVIYLTCDADLPTCEPNPNHDLNLCRNNCILNGRYQGFEVTGLFGKVEFRNFVLLSKEEITQIDAFPKEVRNLRQLKSMKIGNLDIGMAVASSLISYTREPYPNPQHYRSFVEASIVSGLKVYFSIINHIKMIQPDKMYIFNGRFACLRPAVRAAELLSVPYEIHERAGVNGKYTLTPNTTPHDFNYGRKLVSSFWDASAKDLQEKVEIGSRWFIDRRQGVPQNWFSYTADKKGTPDFIDPQKLNIVIFNSSQDEYEAIEGWENPFYRSQTQGLYRLAKDLASLENVQFYLRVHPSLSKQVNSQTKAIAKLKGKYKNFHIIDADSTINSYLLLDRSDLVITFGSTMGIEASFWEKPSILLGKAVYQDLGAAYIPESHSEVISLIREGKFRDIFTDLQERKLRAVKYGFFCQEYGIPFKLFDQHDYLKLTHKATGIHIEKGMHWQTRQLQQELQMAERELQMAERELTSIKLSKFWKLRNRWLEIKRKLGLIP